MQIDNQLLAYIEKTGKSPSDRDIMAIFGLKTIDCAMGAVNRLKNDGKISFDKSAHQRIFQLSKFEYAHLNPAVDYTMISMAKGPCMKMRGQSRLASTVKPIDLLKEIEDCCQIVGITKNRFNRMLGGSSNFIGKLEYAGSVTKVKVEQVRKMIALLKGV